MYMTVRSVPARDISIKLNQVGTYIYLFILNLTIYQTDILRKSDNCWTPFEVHIYH